MSARESEKARRYIESLDTARCSGHWHEVPELVRKISKHAPNRKCLIQTARAECQIAGHVNNNRPATAATSPVQNKETNKETNLLDLIPALLSAIEESGDYPQDVFQAQVCLGWLHWVLSEPALAASRLPKDIGLTVEVLSADGRSLSSWTEVCIIKAGYMKGAAQSLVSCAGDAMRTLTSTLSRISASLSNSSPSPQFLFWSEQLLAKNATLATDTLFAEGPSTDEGVIEIALKSFRLWASHPTVKRGDPASAVQSNAPANPGSHASLWRVYYSLLSTLLQQGMAYFPPAEGPKRIQLSTEFRRVEGVCENILLKSTKFPKANSSNKLVEDWVEEVIQNWEVLCGPKWCDEDFGEGGQDAVSRNVLDILYRAATKTFHSTLILRRLFHVHLTLAEFELALKALDTYLDIVRGAQDRAKQSAHRMGDLEDDDTFARTLSEGVIMLSCFGSKKEAEKAKQLTELLEGMLDNIGEGHDRETTPTSEVVSLQLPSDLGEGRNMSPVTIALAYRAVGIGLANWARWTPISESRADIQTMAIDALEKSLDPELEDDTNIATSFALAVLLAEKRNVDGAIECIRTALATMKSMDYADVRRGSHSPHVRERDLVPLWHLLALLLTSSEDYETALEACEAAFESLPNASLPFDQNGTPSPTRPRGRRSRSERWLSITGSEHAKGIISEMEAREKESIVELRMTQLAITEILDGPGEALNHSDELLRLFGILFGNVGVHIGREANKKSGNLAPPKSSAGTVKSLRGSIFGRKKSVKRLAPLSDADSISSRVPSTSSGTQIHREDAPSIQVTDEDQRGTEERPQTSSTRKNSMRRRDAHSSQKLHRKDSRKSKNRSPGRYDGPSSPEISPARKHSRHPAEDGQPTPEDVLSTTSGPNGSSPGRHALPRIAHNVKHTKQPAPAGHAKQPPQQDIRLPTTSRFDSPTAAVTRLPRIQGQKHALGILVKIWLFIAGLYRRASLYDDARDACNEASEQATRIEALIAGQESSARAFINAGWGITKSSDELWADIYSERGHLASIQSLPYDAAKQFEEALMYYPNHAGATVGLSSLLLDVYEQILPAEEPQPSLEPDVSTLSLLSPTKREENWPFPASEPSKGKSAEPSCSEKTSVELNRLASRDRAYGLLSELTKLGCSWDNSEAWLALARAHEQSGQIEKAKEVLWWVVDLEDKRPVRHWWNLGSGGYVL